VNEKNTYDYQAGKITILVINQILVNKNAAPVRCSRDWYKIKIVKVRVNYLARLCIISYLVTM
jgi:hypothetical protein